MLSALSAFLSRAPEKTTLLVCEPCGNESHISQSKVKYLPKETFFMIFSLSLMFFLWTDVSILSFCSLQSSRCFLKNLSPVQVSHCQSVLLTWKSEPRTLDG